MKTYLSRVAALTTITLLLLAGLQRTSNVLGQVRSDKPTPESVQASDSTETETVFGLSKEMTERLLSSIRKGAFSKNPIVSNNAFRMFSEHPQMHQMLGEGVQMELVKRGLTTNNTLYPAFQILIDSKISGIERQDLLLKIFKITFELGAQQSNFKEAVVAELVIESQTLTQRFADEIGKEPLGDHSDKLLVIEHLGPSAESTLPALVKRYHALKDSAAKEGRQANYMDVLYAVGEIQSKDGMEVILDACNEQGSKERDQYAIVGYVCLNRLIEKQGPTLDDSRYLKYAEGVIKTYDKDADGLLSQDEMSKMRRPPNMNGDRNRDSKLSLKELAASLGMQSSRTSSSRSRPRSLIRNSVGFKE